MTAAAELRSQTLKATADAHAKMIEYWCKAHGLPAPEREIYFTPERRWRLDFVWWGCGTNPDVALEIQGGIFGNGAHSRPLGYERDCEKLAAAQLAGWVVFFASTRQLKSGLALEWVRKALEMRK
jgi:hypothetical protein